jgi:hypothetical protein
VWRRIGNKDHSSDRPDAILHPASLIQPIDHCLALVITPKKRYSFNEFQSLLGGGEGAELNGLYLVVVPVAHEPDLHRVPAESLQVLGSQLGNKHLCLLEKRPH